MAAPFVQSHTGGPEMMSAHPAKNFFCAETRPSNLSLFYWSSQNKGDSSEDAEGVAMEATVRNF